MAADELQLIVLGSGSRGNAAVLSCGRFTMLIDAGLSPRRVHRACRAAGVAPPSHILLTHPDTDHLYRSWSTFTNRGEVLLHLQEGHVAHATRMGFDVQGMRPFNRFTSVDMVRVDALLGAHDDHGTCVFRLSHDVLELGWATDVGRFTQAMQAHLAGVHLLAIESNYDRDLQEHSDRPWYLKQRIMGGQGHLSNDETLQAVTDLHALSPLQRVVLLHLSQQCNCPLRIDALWQARAPHLADRLVVTNQHDPVQVDLFSPQPS